MATTITGKLNKPAREFQAGAYTGFGVNIGKQYYDSETKQKEWTNYEAAFFSNNSNQIDFMRGSLVEGAIVEVTASNEKIKSFDGNNGPVLSIQLLECKLGYVNSPQQGAPAQAPQQPAYGQAPQQPPAQPAYGQTPQQPAYGQAPQQPQYPPQQAPQNQMAQTMGHQQSPK